MATRISVTKGLKSILTVAVSYGVSAGAAAIADAIGIEIPQDMQDKIILTATAGLSGLITGALNWLKHKNDKPVPAK
jgi:hypothetical protein